MDIDKYVSNATNEFISSLFTSGGEKAKSVLEYYMDINENVESKMNKNSFKFHGTFEEMVDNFFNEAMTSLIEKGGSAMKFIINNAIKTSYCYFKNLEEQVEK